jgi:hypothetical protein
MAMYPHRFGVSLSVCRPPQAEPLRIHRFAFSVARDNAESSGAIPQNIGGSPFLLFELGIIGVSFLKGSPGRLGIVQSISEILETKARPNGFNYLSQSREFLRRQRAGSLQPR